jgi:hypothetical protein
MFGWRSAKCPIDTFEKTWTEWRMRWLADQFGIERLLQSQVILPTDEFFPDPFRGTAEDARRLMDRICDYLAIDSARIEFEVCTDVQMPGAAGHYDNSERTTIRIAESQLAKPEQLVATLVHELAHEMLLGGGLLSTAAKDHEWVTDLLPVFSGAGIFAANATVSEGHRRSGNWYWWSVGKHGYLPARIFGYAFALFAFMRKEENPAWASHLRLDASSVLHDGLRFLQKSNDCLFHPGTIHLKRPQLSGRELATQLQTGSTFTRLATLWEISEQPTAEDGVVTAVTACLTDRDQAISGAAGRTLAALGPAAASALPQLVAVLSPPGDETRAGAARALGSLCLEPKTVVPELAALLAEENNMVVAEAALALRQFGRQAEPATKQLLPALTKPLIDCEYSLIDLLASTMVAIAPDPHRCVYDYFSESDSEVRRLALAAIEEQSCLAREKQSKSQTNERQTNLRMG